MDVELTVAEKEAGLLGRQLFATFQERIKATKDAAAAQVQQSPYAKKTQPAAQGKGKGKGKGTQDQTMTGDTDEAAETSQHGTGQSEQEKQGKIVTAENNAEEDTETPSVRELTRLRRGKRPDPPVESDSSEVEITGETRHVSEPVTNNVRIPYPFLSF